MENATIASQETQTVLDIDNDTYELNESDSKGITLAWVDLSYSINSNGETSELVSKVTGIVYPGEVVAVMGPSGAGKSTFLDTLSGRKDTKNISGSILLNGYEGKIKHVSTYVMQDDALLGSLTVRENIMYAAKLCLSAKLSDAERRERVDKMITDFGLGRVADTKVGTPFIRGISGGERRRVSIASQIINTPEIIFLDEPTSGLDSASAYNVIRVIKKMALARKLTIIATIHQPNTDTYSLFDKVYLLARGKTIYFGPRKEAPEYFERVGHKLPNFTNPADFFMKLINKDFENEGSQDEKFSSVEDLARTFVGSAEYKKINDQVQQSINNKTNNGEFTNTTSRATFARGFAAQTRILVSRGLLNARRNPLVFWIRVLMYMAMAFLMGTTWYHLGSYQDRLQDRFSAHFFAVAFLAFMSVAGIPGFLEERLVFQRERANGFYRVGAYVLANTIVSIPYVFIISFSFTIVAYYWIGLNPGLNQFLTYLAFLFLALYVAESMVIFVSTLLPIFVGALTVVAFMNGFFMVVQGYFVQKNNIPRPWIWGHYIDYQKYAFEALLQNDFQNLTFQCERQASGQCFCLVANPDSPDGCSFSGQTVLNQYGYSDVKKWLWALALIIMILVYRIGTYVVLRVRKNKQ